MNKILLVIQREYTTRVRKVSFWLLTLLVPILLAALYAIPIYMALKPQDRVVVLVADESGVFGGLDRDDASRGDSRFVSNDVVEYRYAASLEYARRVMDKDEDVSAILYVRSRASEAIPTDACLYYKSDLPTQQTRYDVDMQLQRILRNRLLQAHGISDDEYALISGTKINLRTEDMETGREAFLGVKTALGLVLSLLIYVAIFMFGSQVMRGVVEEKSSRIVEVVVCSVKPFQLMMGKVIGIALVGLTQFLMWVMLTGVALVGIQAGNRDLFGAAQQKHAVTEIATKGSEATAQMSLSADMADVPQMVEEVLHKSNMQMGDIDLWVFHQANKYMINYIRKMLEIDKERFYIYMEHVGNTVSSTIPIALCAAREEGKLHGNVMLAGFGVGLSWGSVMLKIF